MIAPPHRISIVEVARSFLPKPGTTNTGARQSCFAKAQRSRYNRVKRSLLPYPPPSPARERTVRGKAAVKAAKRARQRARRRSA